MNPIHSNDPMLDEGYIMTLDCDTLSRNEYCDFVSDNVHSDQFRDRLAYECYRAGFTVEQCVEMHKENPVSH